MPRRLLLLALLASTTAVRAEEATPPSAADASPPTPQQRVADKLPAFSEEAHAKAVAEEQARTAAKAAAAEDPEIVVLPDMTVQEKAIQRMTEESLYRKGAYDKELVKRELSEFDRGFLNRYSIPFLGVSNEARAREAYLARKNAERQDRFSRLNHMTAVLDPAEAREFREVLRDAQLDNSNTTKDVARSRSARGGSGGRNSQ